MQPHPLQPQLGSVPQLHIQPQAVRQSVSQSESPHQVARSFSSPHPGGPGAPNGHHPAYSHIAVGSGGQPGPDSFYNSSPYPNNHGLPTPTSVHFSAGDTPEMMSTAQMQPRPYSLYTPQSHSPASHGPEQPNRGMYGPPHHLPQSMYYPSTYPMGHMPSTTYSPHTSQTAQAPAPPPAQMMTPPHTAVPPHTTQPSVAHPPSVQTPTIASSPRTASKFEPNVPRPLDGSNPHRTSISSLSSNQAPSASHPANGNAPGAQAGLVNSNNQSAAPGPIPATTPLVVRQDNNGVQWIAFEYSKDRVKMEYQIRCDVESVNTDALSKEFKDANCVYPRAHCEASKYQGNRWSYETECNTVGWSLAELNPSLREKRGLIQRAVDSWRNSNQDARLRSRRVRRMNKQATREKNANAQPVTGPREVGQVPDPRGLSSAMLQQRPLPPAMTQTGPGGMSASAAPLHHPHPAAADGPLSGVPSSLSLSSSFDAHHQSVSKSHSADTSHMRPAHVFPGYPTYPLQSHGVAVPPPLPNGMEPHLPSHPATTIPVSKNAMQIGQLSAIDDHTSDIPPLSRDMSHLYSHLPSKKFINMSDPGHNPSRVRVKLDLRDVNMEEVVDDFRERNSVYPRSYFPNQLQLTAQEKRDKRRRGRFLLEHEGDFDDDGPPSAPFNGMGKGRTLVKLPTLDGEAEVAVPRLGKRVGQKEEVLNDVGYRISWDQCQRYDKRTAFLQRSLDAWRSKMFDEHSSAQENTLSRMPRTPSLLERRPGKTAWLARRNGRQPSVTTP